MSDGEIVELNELSVQSIHSPGHTSGCVVYLVDTRLLFVGDLLVNPGFARYSTELQIINRENVLRLDGVEYVFTAHFGLFKNIRFFQWRFL
jgi:glyoxylase-like metal-dependent hydrolase (beta-lactamase superfamily II)